MDTVQPGFASLLLDTNIWLDYYLGFRAGHKDAQSLLIAASQCDIPLLCTVGITKDVFYLIAADFKRDYRLRHDGVLTKEGAAAATEVAWACLEHLEDVATMVGCDQSDMALARIQRSLHNDYEDNLCIAALQRVHGGCLVTNDEDLVRHSPVAALTCRDALAYLQARQTTQGLLPNP